MNDTTATPTAAANPLDADDRRAYASLPATPIASVPVASVPVPAPWSRIVDIAQARWRWITIPDLLTTGGRERPLADLVCQRYGIAHADAVRQVRLFLQQHPVTP